MLNILGKRYFFFALSLLIIIPGLIMLGVNGMPLSIDFEGGTYLELQFPSGTLPSTEQVKGIYDANAISDAQIQTTDQGTLIIRSSALDESVRTQIIDELAAISGGDVVITKADTVGPSIGKGVTKRALEAVGLAALAIVIYITFAFRGIPHAFRYGVAAIVAMLHDILVIIGLEAILCHLLGWEVDSLFLTALLTIIGFSVHDTIVVFDRIRENRNIYRKLPYETVVNHSIVQTLDRSINTSVTVILTMLALALFGGVTIRHFVVIILIGIISGTYSSIFNASPILVVWENQEWKTWFKKNDAENSAA